MQQAILNQDGTYYKYHNGVIIASPLNSASHQWSAMIHYLRNDPVFRNQPKLAKAYIQSSVAYLVTFPLQTIIKTIFKYPTLHSSLASNYFNQAWKKIKIPRNQIVPFAQGQLVLRVIETLVHKPQPDRFLSDRISIDHAFFNEQIKIHILHRKILAVVMSLLPGSHIDKLGEELWLCVLEAIANDNVSACPSVSLANFKPLTHFERSGNRGRLPGALPAGDRGRSQGARADREKAQEGRRGARQEAGAAAAAGCRDRVGGGAGSAAADH